MTLRVYAGIVGVALLCYSLVGFANAMNTSLVGDFYRLGLSAFFLFVSFGLREAQEWELQVMVGGLGAFTLLTAIPIVWYAHYHGLSHRPIEFTGVVVGLVSVLAAVFLPGNRTGRSAG